MHDKKKNMTILHQIQSPEKKVGLFEIWSLEKKKLLKIAEKKIFAVPHFYFRRAPETNNFFWMALTG